ncbi:group-specific protein [Bacillus tianshenii]|nr:group-specific protein [Bacillus tianshenii]
MNSSGMRLRKVQNLAQEIMDEVNRTKEARDTELLNLVIDNLSRAVVDATDPSGHYSIEYLENKVGNAHSLLFKKKADNRVSAK